MHHRDEVRKRPAAVRLLKRWQKGVINLVFSRMALIVVLLLIQAGFLISVLIWLKDLLPHVLGGQFLLTCGMVLYLVNSSMDPSGKITWLVLMLVAPVFGSLLYLFSLREIGHRAMQKQVRSRKAQAAAVLRQDEKTEQALAAERPGGAALARYVRGNGGFPVYTNTAVTYLPSGEEKWKVLLRELEQAQSYIFLEYFIVEEGDMWGSILEVLIRKAAQGVDVRVLYDGTCEFMLLPKGYPRKLEALGIRCKVFAPFIPLMSTHYNFRDHRKIAVIDGHTAFNGGINLADEYINHRQKFGHWKDTAVLLKGEAVRSFTRMFLETWSLDEKNLDFFGFLSTPIPIPEGCGGYVMPYGDDPMGTERVGKRVYMDLMNRAEKSVDIMTPYLILDSELENTIKYAAARGGRVRIILPGISDKKIAHALAKTHYPALLDAGVELYEYTPGFVHAKVMVCDGVEAVVGTINLDYRSLYHHFECATYLCGCPAIGDIEKDFVHTLDQCRRVDGKNLSRWSMLLGSLCKLAAPLL